MRLRWIVKLPTRVWRNETQRTRGSIDHPELQIRMTWIVLVSYHQSSSWIPAPHLLCWWGQNHQSRRLSIALQLNGCTENRNLKYHYKFQLDQIYFKTVSIWTQLLLEKELSTTAISKSMRLIKVKSIWFTEHQYVDLSIKKRSNIRWDKARVRNKWTLSMCET